MRRIFRRVRGLDAENNQLKQVYVELTLDNTPIEDLIAKKSVGSAQKREAEWDHVEVHARPLSQSCDCVDMSRSTWRPPPILPSVSGRGLLPLQPLGQRLEISAFQAHEVDFDPETTTHLGPKRLETVSL